jgi:hypothetical protein
MMTKTWDLPHLGLLADSSDGQANVLPFAQQHLPYEINIHLWQYFAFHFALLSVALIVSTAKSLGSKGLQSL